MSDLRPGPSKCGLSAVAWELVRNAETWAPHQAYWIEICNLPRSPGGSCARSKLRSTFLEKCSLNLATSWNNLGVFQKHSCLSSTLSASVPIDQGVDLDLRILKYILTVPLFLEFFFFFHVKTRNILSKWGQVGHSRPEDYNMQIELRCIA